MFAFLFTKNRIILSIIIILFIAATLYSLNQFFLYTPDSARYVAWANSLAHFNGFTDDTGPESKRYMLHSPLYSLLLAPIAYLLPGDIIILKILNIILSVITILFLFLLLSSKGDKSSSLIIVAMFAVHPMVYIFSTQILTEVLFGCGLVALLYFLQNELQENSTVSNFMFVLISLLVCVFSREIGALCVPVVLFFYFMRKNYTKIILIFFIPLILYSVWFIRNEIYYANVEHVGFKNSVVFFSNIMTSSDAGFGKELTTRILTNGRFYLNEMMILIYSSTFHVFDTAITNEWDRLINIYTPIVRGVISIVHSSYWIFSIISICFIISGIIIEILTEKTFYIKIFIFTFYAFIILLYPVLDTRFLYPIFIIFLMWIHSSFSYLAQRSNRVINISLGVIAIGLSIPNLVWTMSFVDTQHRLSTDPLGTFLCREDSLGNIKHNQVLFPKAGEWLNMQNDPSQVVISPHEELAFYLKNKKVFSVNRMTPTSFFNQVIQNYDVRYIVLSKDNLGWLDYEIQFEFNEQFTFQLVFNYGAINIYEIYPKAFKNVYRDKYSSLALAMKNRNYLAADSLLTQNRNLVNQHADLLYLNIVNKHYLGQLDSASLFLEQLYTKPQGLAHTRLAAIHKTAISRRTMLDRIPLSDYRSSTLMNLAVMYWQLDMRDLSLAYYQQCIDEDSTVALAHVCKVILSLCVKDTTSAIKAYYRMRSVFPNAELTEKIDSLMKNINQLRATGKANKKAEFLEGIFDIYQFLGFTIPAKEVAKQALMLDPSRISVYKKLGILFDDEYEYYPALINLNQYSQHYGNDSTVNSKIIDLKQKLYLNGN